MSTDADKFMIPAAPLLSASFLTLRDRGGQSAGAATHHKGNLFLLARNAIYHSLRALGVAKGESILVPAYICKAAVAPITVYGAEPVFYQVRADCTPDYHDLEEKINGRTRAVLAVHYFGFPQAIGRLRALCDQHRLFLIEDCAHVLQGEMDGRRLGTIGDASVFSWRKFLPLFDGGELILNHTSSDFRMDWRPETMLFTLRVAKFLVDQIIYDSTHPAFRTVSKGLEVSKRAFLGWMNRSGKPAPALEADTNSALLDRDLLDFPMSRLSRLVLGHSYISRIVEKRRKNYQYLQDTLSRQDGIRFLFPELPANVCPWVFPLFFENMPNAHLALRERGIPAVTWGGVRPAEVSREIFPAAEYLYENLIFIPVHQNLSEKHLEIIGKTVRAVRQSRSSVAVASLQSRREASGGRVGDFRP
jgi:dTDP-4-amino-4,6-dideoxygalactose transaminase